MTDVVNGWQGQLTDAHAKTTTLPPPSPPSFLRQNVNENANEHFNRNVNHFFNRSMNGNVSWEPNFRYIHSDTFEEIEGK